jgi:integrase
LSKDNCEHAAFDLLKGANKRDRVVTFKEEGSDLDKARINSAVLAAFVSQQFDTAMCPEEGYRLRGKQDGGLYGKGVLRFRHSKTDGARREVPISPRVQRILRARWDTAGKPQRGWIWSNPDTHSGHVEPSTFKKMHAKSCKQAKISPFVLHEARHIIDPSGLLRLWRVDVGANPGIPEDYKCR